MEAFRPLAFIYIFERLVFRVFEFFRRWYVGFGVFLFHATARQVESFDRTLALKITIMHFFSPLFGDHSILGRILGVIFRTIRICVAVVVYLVIFLVALFVYLCWALVPLVALLKVVGF